MAPMTKEEYEKQQSVMKHVIDPDTGRYRYEILLFSSSSQSSIMLFYIIFFYILYAHGKCDLKFYSVNRWISFVAGSRD